LIFAFLGTSIVGKGRGWSSVTALGATLSFPRFPAKVPSPSDLPTFVIVHCQRVVFEFTIGQRVAALPADLRAEVDTDDDGKRPRPIGQAGQIPAADVPFARGTVPAGK